MKIENPNKNNGLKVLIELLKEKKLITENEIKTKLKKLKANDKKEKSI